MKNFEEIPSDLRDKVLNSKSLAVWPIDQSPMHTSYQTARYFQDLGWEIYPVHDFLDRILEVQCYRDIRLIPEDYDILLLYTDIDQLPRIVNAIFNADYQPPLVWTPEGLIDLESIDRLNDGGISNVMDTDLMEFHNYWTNKE